MLEGIIKEQSIKERKKHSLIKGKIKYYVLAAVWAFNLAMDRCNQSITIRDYFGEYYINVNHSTINKSDSINDNNKNLVNPQYGQIKSENDFKELLKVIRLQKTYKENEFPPNK